MSSPAPLVFALPHLAPRLSFDATKPPVLPFDIPGFPRPAAGPEAGAASAAEGAVGDEIDLILDQSRKVRDAFSQKRGELFKEYREAERSVAKMLEPRASQHPTCGLAHRSFALLVPVLLPPCLVPPCGSVVCVCASQWPAAFQQAAPGSEGWSGAGASAVVRGGSPGQARAATLPLRRATGLVQHIG